MRSLAILFALGVATSLLACGGSSAGDDPVSEDALNRSDVVKLDDDDKGKTISVEKGKKIELRLSSPGSGGYKWMVVSTDRSFGYPDPKEGSFEASGGGRAGGGGSHVFVWDTASRFITPGGAAHAVKLEYRRPFEDDSAPAAEKFSFKVKITEADEQPPAPELRPIVVKESDDGERVRAKEGQDVTVRLPATPSAGYRWYVESVDRTLGYPEITYEANNPDPMRAGGAGTSILTWKTGPSGPMTKVGSHSIKLKYSRGESGDALREFGFTLVIVAVADEDDYECPAASRRSINCMPPVAAASRTYCAADYRTWAESHCDVSFLD